MPATINDLPYELLTEILEHVICYKVEQNIRKSHGLDTELHVPPDPDVRMQQLVKGRMTPDAVRWIASNTIRQVNSRWHGIALEYAFRDLYVLSWRGSERHMFSGVARNAPAEHLSLATSSESSLLLRKTKELLENHPTLSPYIRRIWFDGYCEANSIAMIFGVLRQCKKLEDLLIPWTALRYGTIADWSSLFGSHDAGPCVTSLEIRAMNIPKGYSTTKKESAFSTTALESINVDFSNLACLKLCANSRSTSITDKDLIAIARTARNLRELHVDAVFLGPKGIRVLIWSSQSSLEVLELEGSSQIGFTQPEHRNSDNHLRFPQLVAQCPRLHRLKLSSVRTCRDIFACDNITWSRRVQIHLGLISPFQVNQSDDDTAVFYEALDQARYLMNSRVQPDEKNVEIDFFISNYIFEPRCAQVHGDFPTHSTVREPWLFEKKKSDRKEQKLGYVREYPFRITEDEFKDGSNKGYVWL